MGINPALIDLCVDAIIQSSLPVLSLPRPGHCDHGQRYCTGGCSQAARKESIKRAGEKYQATRPGRINNAARQQQKVTHHCSVAIMLRALLQTLPDALNKAELPVNPGATVRCHHCGALCESFLRSDFLHSSQFRRRFRHR